MFCTYSFFSCAFLKWCMIQLWYASSANCTPLSAHTSEEQLRHPHDRGWIFDRSNKRYTWSPWFTVTLCRVWEIFEQPLTARMQEKCLFFSSQSVKDIRKKSPWRNSPTTSAEELYDSFYHNEGLKNKLKRAPLLGLAKSIYLM